MSKLIAHDDPKSPVSEAYRTIRTNLQFSGVDKEMKTIVVTSATPNEGKSTVISNLAAVMAQASNKVILVDCDFRNPTLHKIFEIPNKGLSNCLALGNEVIDVVQKIEGFEELYVITSGPVAPNPSELLTSNGMKKLLAKLKENYDYVLIDTPPVLPVTDAAALASQVDGVLQVVAWGANSPEEEKEATNRLRKAGANILGAVLNKVEVGNGKQGYGYGYGYGYYYYYGDDGTKHEHEHHHKHHDDDGEKEAEK